MEMLGACAISPEAVRTRLDGGTEGTGAQEDDLPLLLHATRDVLLGFINEATTPTPDPDPHPPTDRSAHTRSRSGAIFRKLIRPSAS